MVSRTGALILIILLIFPLSLAATESEDSTLLSVPFYKKGIIGKVYNYFDNSNKTSEDKGLDISFIGGPYYSSDTKFGLALVSAAQYRHDKFDFSIPVSDVAVKLQGTTSMFFELSVDGNHIFPHDSQRLSYTANVAYSKTRFWGIGYDMDSDNSNESRYKYIKAGVEAAYKWRVGKRFFAGPLVSINYIHGFDLQKPYLWQNEDSTTFNLGVGLTAQLDTRDNLTAPLKGVYLRVDQLFNPKFMGNKYAYSLTELTFSSYNKVWKNAIVAFRYHARLTYGNTPWGMLSTLGGSKNMRGYFEGRYRDKMEMDATLELRQRIWRRNGAVAWIGAGTVFPKFSALSLRKILPNYGVGYRWEFKKNMNVRLDVGFGRGEWGINFNINEAF